MIRNKTTTKGKIMEPRYAKLINFKEHTKAYIERVARLNEKSFVEALHMICEESERLNPEGIITIGGNGSDHETAN